MRRCKQPQETVASDDEEESLVDHDFKRIKTEYAATVAKASNDKILPGLGPSGCPAASNLLTVTKQISRVPDMSTLQIDNNSHIT